MSGPFGSQQWMYASGGFYSHPIDQSLRFNDDDSAYLSRTPASAGNRKTWTWSGWVKRGNLGSNQNIFASNGTDNTTYLDIRFNSSDQLQVGNYTALILVTTQVFRDPSAWYHVVWLLDTTQATASNRSRLFVNGVEITSFSTDARSSYFAQNTDYGINNSALHEIARNPADSAKHFDGYMAEVNFVDGQALDASSFGENKSGVWIPKRYSGSYGTNGFYLPFKNATIANETDSATITAPFGGTAANGKEPDGNFVTSNTSTGSAFTLVHYDLGSSKNIQEYVIKGLSFTGGTSTFQVQYSNDNSSWTSATALSVTSSSQDFAAAWSVTARYWRVRATAFGTNGTASIDSFQLFSGEIGIDDSGNNNDFSSRKVLPSDILLDTPTNNFATLNPLFPSTGGMTFAEGNLKITGTTSGVNSYTRSTINVPSNSKIYFETVLTNVTGAWQTVGVYSVTSGNAYLQYYSGQAFIAKNSVSQGNVTIPSAGDIIGVALDTSAGTCQFYRNGNTYGSQITGLTTGEYIIQPQVIGNAPGGIQQYNFGQDSSFAGQKTAQGYTDANGIGDFYYQPPSGYLALCTANLPDPVAAIDPALGSNPQDYFNTVLYTGNAPSTQSITGVGFEPDMVWTKSRSSLGNHGLHDIMRLTGSAPNILYPDLTNAEYTASGGGLTSFDSDGFTLTNNNISNTSGVTYAAWNWKAGGEGVTNTDGTITSTVSANQDLGISIVTYTGNGSGNVYPGTGLSSSAPLDMVIGKRRDSTGDWFVGHRFSGQSTNFGYHYHLHTTDALSGFGPYFFGTSSTTDGSTVNVGADGNISGATYVVYCFQSVDGFSKFGSYTGNGSTDGPFVYTGFRPAFVIMKRTDSTSNWEMVDNQRDPINHVYRDLSANSSNAENAVDGTSLDFLSNGFKHRDGTSTGTKNVSGATYIYIAFAEHPFKYANAR